MKGIKKTLMAGLLTCAALNHAKAEEVPALSFGLKAGPSVCSPVRYSDDVKINGKGAESTFFDSFWGFGGPYIEYAFTDYLGMELGAVYMTQGASLKGKEENKGNEENKENNSGSCGSSISMFSHGIAFPLSINLYPLGRGEEEWGGTLKVMLGASAYVPFTTTYKNGNNDVELNEKQKKEIPFLDIAVTGGLGYEHLCGLVLEAKYAFGLMNRFNTEDDKEQTIFDNVQGLKSLHVHHATIGIGYNFATLFSE